MFRGLDACCGVEATVCTNWTHENGCHETWEKLVNLLRAVVLFREEIGVSFVPQCLHLWAKERNRR